MPLTYNTFVTSLANMLVVPLDDANFVAAVPNIIDDAEQRLYRELDLLATNVVDTSTTMSVGSRAVQIPLAFVVVDTINVLTPVGPLSANSVRHPLVPASLAVIDSLFPSTRPLGDGLPQYFTPITQWVFRFGPAPDQAYTLEVIGTQRPAPLSFTNQTTFLSANLPDVFLAAALVFSAGYQLNFSAGGDNPAAGMTWESHVKNLIDSAKVEELRKKFGSQGWTSKEPNQLATPPRT